MINKRPYHPIFIHQLFDRIERLRMPVWLFYLLVMVLLGTGQHLIAWNKGALNLGDFNVFLGFSGLWVVEIIFLGRYLHKGGGKILDEFSPLLTVSPEEYERLKFEFTMIPRKMGTFFLVLGAVLALIGFDASRQVSPEVNFSAPIITVGSWMFTSGLGIMLIYQSVRQLQQIKKFFNRIEKINLYNLTPIYAFSKMTATLGVSLFIILFVTPLLINPEYFESEFMLYQAYIILTISIAIFYIPLAEVNQRLIKEKQKALDITNRHIETILHRIHASVENEDYSNSGEMGHILNNLKEEKKLIEAVPTWPWKPATFKGFVSAVFLPVLIWAIQELLGKIL